MGVAQPRKNNKAAMEEIQQQLKALQTRFDELQRDENDGDSGYEEDDGDDACLPDCEPAASKSKRPQRAGRKRRREDVESDDEEEIPENVRIKMEKLAKAGKNGSGTRPVPDPVAGVKRKQTFSTTEAPAGVEDDLGRPVNWRSTNSRAEREARRYATKSAKASKRARLASDSDEPDTATRGAGKLPSISRKNRAAQDASRTSINSSFKQTKPARPAPAFKPSSGAPLPTPRWAAAAPTTQPEATFKLPTSSLKANEKRPNTTSNQPNLPGTPASNSRPPNDSTNTPPTDPTYAEIEPFDFKLIKSYPGNEIEFHHSTDLKDNMKAFWSILKRQRQEWEEAAGAEWAWELQKSKNNPRGKRFCVARKLAKLATRWRKGDKGLYACRDCAEMTALCFTWVRDEDAESDGECEDEDGIPEPKGEFWCLPIHEDDQRCEVTKDREIRTWLNEGDKSESDSSGEEIGESSEEDQFKVGSSDLDQLSRSESSSSEEDDGQESDDDEL